MAKNTSKSPDKRPARANYWSGQHLMKNKVRNLLKNNPVYAEAGIDSDADTFKCPSCSAQNTMKRVKRYSMGHCPSCGYKLKTRPLTETEAKAIFRDRKRHKSKAA